MVEDVIVLKWRTLAILGKGPFLTLGQNPTMQLRTRESVECTPEIYDGKFVKIFSTTKRFGNDVAEQTNNSSQKSTDGDEGKVSTTC